MRYASEPRDEAELLARARALSGLTLGEVARSLELEVPPSLHRAKGFVGQLTERALGARASSRAGPDFATLGVELKTLPVDARGRPVESTFVCTISLRDVGDVDFRDSPVWKKLSRVLFVPVQGERERPVAERRLGEPLLWSPSPEEEADLRFDWDDLAGLIGRGSVEAVTGHLGRCLQVRPKGANARERRLALDADGVTFAALPRGFYLRPAFTERIIRAYYAVGA